MTPGHILLSALPAFDTATIQQVLPLTSFLLWSTQTVRRQYFNRFADLSANTRGGMTVERMFDACSYRKLLFNEPNNIIDNLTMPCAGRALAHAHSLEPAYAAFRRG